MLKNQRSAVVNDFFHGLFADKLVPEAFEPMGTLFALRCREIIRAFAGIQFPPRLQSKNTASLRHFQRTFLSQM